MPSPSFPSDPRPARASQAGTYSITELQLEWVCARGAALARAGRLPDAQHLLDEGLDCLRPARPARLLDLLARVYYQAGVPDEARALWREAVQQQPDDEVYAAALERLEAELAPAPEATAAAGGEPSPSAGSDGPPVPRPARGRDHSRTTRLLYASLAVSIVLLAVMLWMVLNLRSARTVPPGPPAADSRRATPSRANRSGEANVPPADARPTPERF